MTLLNKEKTMQKIIDFLHHKQQKETEQIEILFKKAHSLDEKLDLLLANKHLQVDDYKLFLAFLAYLEEHKIEAQQLFKDVLKLPKYQFEMQYEMNWGQVVKLSVTFLTILRTNDPESYKQFTH